MKATSRFLNKETRANQIYKQFLKANGFEYKHGQWRLFISSPGLPLTQGEHETNRLGGKPFGKTAKSAVENLTQPCYELADAAKAVIASNK